MEIGAIWLNSDETMIKATFFIPCIPLPYSSGKRLHYPDPAGAGITAESAGNTFFIVGDVFILLGLEITAGNGVGGADRLAEMTVPTSAAA